MITVNSYIFSFLSCIQPLQENRFVIPKSRYDSISTYLSPEGNKYNDIDLVHDQEICQQLVDAGMWFYHLIFLVLLNTIIILIYIPCTQ